MHVNMSTSLSVFSCKYLFATQHKSHYTVHRFVCVDVICPALPIMDDTAL